MARPFSMKGFKASRRRAALARSGRSRRTGPSSENRMVSSASPPSMSSVSFTITVLAIGFIVAERRESETTFALLSACFGS